MPRYVFVSVYPQLFLMTLLGSMVLFTTIALLADVLWWIAPVTIVVVHGVFILSRIGTIRLVSEPHGHQLSIRDWRGRYRLTTPIHATAWWSYDFDDDDPETRGGSRSNDIHVVVQLVDAARQQLCIVERITFDTRFPNEMPYDDRGTTQCAVRILVQRADHVFRFLERHLPAEELLNENASHDEHDQSE
ncbi:MAG: hypothetical protein R3301_13920 [Saprospiraceae bacterium]|nr:hypothetical protein [Saprospiraceae bacterium]